MTERGMCVHIQNSMCHFPGAVRFTPRLTGLRATGGASESSLEEEDSETTSSSTKISYILCSGS